MPGTTVVQKLNRCCPQSGGNMIAACPDPSGEKALFGSFLGQQKGTKKSYYRHGPLARTILGQQQVQGIDYAYTLQGWLKGINSTAVGDGTFDMGTDGKTSSANRFIARDAFGFSLNYFNGDYASINVNPFAQVSNSLPNVTDSKAAGKDLFNGNIRAMLVNIPQLGDAYVYGYRYDQLNRIVGMNSYTGLSGNTFTASGTANYRERVSYDANGNILEYLRNGTTAGSNPLDMDSLSYKYYAGNNRLKYVDDAVSSGNYSTDINDQSDNNYGYDEIGNLTSDVSEGITSINWNVYGKIKSITKSGGNISYSYDALGNRISKTHNGKTTWYVRDASGNVMSIYVKEAAINNNHLTQDEIHLYGISRLGILNVNEDMEIAHVPGSGQIDRGKKIFELANHLGNVLATISDKKIGIPQASPNAHLVDYYEADVVSANDYYPGGSLMPGRKYRSNYRYGFNGKENDNEMKGENNSLDLGLRIYDPRLARFLSTDPREEEYPWQSSYAYFSNNFTYQIDFDGGGDEHKVKKGETLSGIAKSRGTTVKMLQQVNNIKDPDKILAGQKLVLPTMSESMAKELSATAIQQLGLNSLNIKGVHFVMQDFTPEIFSLTTEATTVNPQWHILSYNGGGEAADRNRRSATRQLPGRAPQGRSRDEFPYASTMQGGSGAFVRFVPTGEQQFQAIDLQFMYNGYGTGNKMQAGDRFLVVVVPKLSTPLQPGSKPITVPQRTPPLPVVVPFSPRPTPAPRPTPIPVGPMLRRVPMIMLIMEMWDAFERPIQNEEFRML